MNVPAKKGFTLIEVLIALFILAIVAVIATSGLRSVINLQRGTRAGLEQLQQLQVAMSLMQRDISQIIDQPLLIQGQTQPPVKGTQQTVTFIRAGVVNPEMMFKRSTLQRVSYRVVNDELIRVSQPAFTASKASSKVLLTGVDEFRIAYIGPDNQPTDSWPPTVTESSSKTVQQYPLPKAIAITIGFAKTGSIKRFFIISGRGFNYAPS